MSDSQFSKGNWEVFCHDGCVGNCYVTIICREEPDKLPITIVNMPDAFYNAPDKMAQIKANAHLMKTSPKMYDLLGEVGADLEMALNGAFAETAVNIKTWREILYEDVEKIKQLLKEARGEDGE